MVGIIVSLVVLGLVIYAIVGMVQGKQTDAQTLLSGSRSSIAQNRIPAVLNPSFNEPGGRVYSYTMWILVKDFTFGYGRQRTIMDKGNAPGVFLDSTSNSLIVRVKTYGMTESVLIPNIPAMKWLHLAIVVDQNAVDIYINGTLRQHHTLSQLPDLTDDPVIIGSGWNGVVGNVVYYPRVLSYAEVSTMSQEAPPPDLQPKIGTPNYFDITWYTGRLNSS